MQWTNKAWSYCSGEDFKRGGGTGNNEYQNRKQYFGGKFSHEIIHRSQQATRTFYW